MGKLEDWATAKRLSNTENLSYDLWVTKHTEPFVLALYIYLAVLKNRSELPPASRKLELIPREEVGLAVHQVVSGAYGIGTVEAIAAAGRVLGFGKITAETRTGIELAIRKMVQNGELQDQGGQLMIPSHTGG